MSKHEDIADDLIQAILSDRYAVGDRLPSERELSARYDANRGAVREAMKKLEQIGLVDVQPGGARVLGREEASLDIIGHLLAKGDLPDMVLVDQILIVISGLISVAAEQTTELASDDEIEAIRSLVRPLYAAELDKQAHTSARIALMQSLMMTNKNLPLQLIARTLFEQFEPSIGKLTEYVDLDRDQYATYARQLDQALAKRDLPAVRATFDALTALNRQTMMRAFADARSDLPSLQSQEAVNP